MSEGGGSGFLQVGGEEEEEVAELSQTPDPPSPTHTHTHTAQPRGSHWSCWSGSTAAVIQEGGAVVLGSDWRPSQTGPPVTWSLRDPRETAAGSFAAITGPREQH